MKAMTYTEYGPPDVLRLAEVEKPTPRANEVLVKIHSTTVAAADCFTRRGEPFIARLGNGLRKPQTPILGSTLAGEIEAAGDDVTRFEVGDRVFTATGPRFGAHAEYICLPEDGALARKPANATYGETAAVCAGELTALHFLRDKAKLQRGQSLLVNGASGSVGTAAVQLATYFGARVTGVCSGANAGMVKSLGADAVIDYTKEDFTQTGRTYDIIFDAVGKSSYPRCKGSLTPRGIYLTTVPAPSILLRMAWTAKIGGKRAIVAFAGLRPPREKAKDLAFLTKLVEAGSIKPVIDRRYPLARTAAAYRYVEKGHKKGNVIIDVVDPL